MNGKRNKTAEARRDPENGLHLMHDDENAENSESREDEDMVNMNNEPEYHRSNARLTWVLMVVGILGILLFSVAAISYVVSGSSPFPASIF